MKRFLLFSGINYYPTGGWDDFSSSFDELIDALEGAANQSNIDWWQIVDCESGTIVERKE